MKRLLVRDALRRGMGEITYPLVRAQLQSRTAAGEFRVIERTPGLPGHKFTTTKTIGEAREIINRMQAGRNQLAPALSRQQWWPLPTSIPN